VKQRNLFAFIILFYFMFNVIKIDIGNAQSTTDNVYVLIVNSLELETQIIYLEPYFDANILGNHFIPFSAGLDGYYLARLSPNRQWVSFVLQVHTFVPGNSNPLMIGLYNLQTHDFRSIYIGFPQTENLSLFPGANQTLVWSEDSLEVFFIADESETIEIASLHRYSLVSGTTISLNIHGFQQSNLALISPDNVVTTSLNCNPSNNCASRIEALSTVNGLTLNSRSFAYNIDLPVFPWPICDLKTSPADLVSFLMTCEGLMPDPPKEIHIWNPQTNDVVRVTNYTLPYFSEPMPIATNNAMYETFWHDDDTLLISVTHVRTGVDVNETIAYHPSTQTTTVLSGLMTREWARNPVSGQLAYRAFTTDAFAPVNPVIHLATYTHDTLTVQATLPNGCDLDWSPDGATLAYTVRGTTCTEPVTALAFYDVATGETQQVAVSDYREVLPVGWVRRPTGAVSGQVSVQGVSSPAGLPARVRIAWEEGVVVDQAVPLQADGRFGIEGVPWRRGYTVWVKSEGHLAAAEQVDVVGEATEVGFAALRAGDADGSNTVTIADFSILAAAFGTAQGGTGFDARADFNRDGVVSISDFSLLASNFGAAGAPEPGAVGMRLAGMSGGSTAIDLNASTAVPAVGEAFTVTVAVRAGTQRIDAAGALLTFDPAALQMEAVTMGGALPVELLSAFDNASGQVRLAAGAFSRAPRGTFTLAEVTVRALRPGATTIAFGDGVGGETGAYWRGQSVWDGEAGDLLVDVGG
jgi:hypothetical protein